MHQREDKTAVDSVNGHEGMKIGASLDFIVSVNLFCTSGMGMRSRAAPYHSLC